MKTNEDKIILSIETAIRGGSISIIRGSKQIDFWTGEGEVSKSDEVLHQISILLRKNNVEKREIRFIAVSTGPGSFTGLRIGIALARGLGKSLNCPIKGISALDALTLKANDAKFILTAIPFSKNQICWQLFEAKKPKKSVLNSMQISTEEMFLRDMISGISQKSQINQKNYCLILHGQLY
ncbi:MAG: tRNA (adenosine(37)-N6)-threonylcarbamoyltransferase complex dimerization subunit type 1 TsaB, partial [Acidobacteria bacterium]|nr:tRNA (adenosine(37)-N6)-threonylcarbamoyltransferase complex dimerization subunit type 1 TsaB [Acidobacteriota bacterium]MCA1639885.1 tRNA (adenosine(37)-N6)-threonylcarbamoyltransferase complex dimerization subunit type 1 TsaB [Acidobacteriota bacterium]